MHMRRIRPFGAISLSPSSMVPPCVITIAVSALRNVTCMPPEPAMKAEKHRGGLS
jgi:hypothetical protein